VRYTQAVGVLLRFLLVILVFALAVWLIHKARKIVDR
jgi:hypothetical protein